METTASGQGASRTSEPPKDEGGKEAPKAASQAETGNATAPKNEAEYVKYADAWRDALTDAGEGRKRWKDEKTLRNKANVGPDMRETLQEKLEKKCSEIEDANQS